MRIGLVLGCWLGSLHLMAQQSGVVLDTQTQSPIVGCNIVDPLTQQFTASDTEGKFQWPFKSEQLIFIALGYATDTLQWRDAQGEITVLLKPLELVEVNIVERKGATELSLLNPQGFQTLGVKELCKAACCNLSESFETNASIDAAFTDAITGTKQIRMLGLDGKYTQIMFDNLPGVRGLASTYGLTYVPGPFIHQIQIAKGAGSVTAGYESIAGQINVAHKNPDNAEPLFINGYIGSGGRTELNVILNPKSKKFDPAWSTSLLAHGAYSSLRTDMNGDGFLDNPLFTNLIARNDWRWKSSKGWGGQFAHTYTYLRNTSGQRDYEPSDAIRSQLWGVNITTQRYEVSSKVGYVFPGKEWQSFGSQVSGLRHEQRGNFGFRSYQGDQLFARVNLLFASRIRSDQHKYVVGVTAVVDDYAERIYFESFPPIALNSLANSRNEQVVGAFAEYTWNPRPKWIVVMGGRADAHNLYGIFYTPRLHARWSISETSSLKFMTGQGRRVANILMDNVGMLAGNRSIVGSTDRPLNMSDLDMEVAWNSGVIWSKRFKIAHREASLSVDAYRTNFSQQVVVDFETPEFVQIYNLEGESYSHSVQIETQYTPVRRLDVRMAYRWLEVKTDYASGRLDKPLLNKHRAFLNLAYETKPTPKGAKWSYDFTGQWISSKRIPMSHTMHMHLDDGMGQTYSQSYFQLNAQITRVFNNTFEVYFGGENLTNFMVHDPIVSAENPNDASFDSSLIWGPVFGRMYYFGFRWNLVHV
jgi:outer membrane receptor for ferrienterochelin and colicins